MDECFKFLAAQKIASEKPNASKKKSKSKPKTALIATEEDTNASTEEPPAYTAGYYAYSVNVTGTTLTPSDLILDTGASGSIINNRHLLHNILTVKNSVTFVGISGRLMLYAWVWQQVGCQKEKKRKSNKLVTRE